MRDFGSFGMKARYLHLLTQRNGAYAAVKGLHAHIQGVMGGNHRPERLCKPRRINARRQVETERHIVGKRVGALHAVKINAELVGGQRPWRIVAGGRFRRVLRRGLPFCEQGADKRIFNAQRRRVGHYLPYGWSGPKALIEQGRKPYRGKRGKPGSQQV